MLSSHLRLGEHESYPYLIVSDWTPGRKRIRPGTSESGPISPRIAEPEIVDVRCGA